MKSKRALIWHSVQGEGAIGSSVMRITGSTHACSSVPLVFTRLLDLVIPPAAAQAQAKVQ